MRGRLCLAPSMPYRRYAGKIKDFRRTIGPPGNSWQRPRLELGVTRSVPGSRSCPHCGARLGERDRVCFSCQRAVGGIVSANASSQAGTGGTTIQSVAATTGSASNTGAGNPVELIWGRYRQTFTVPAGGATIGARAAADIVVPATFLAPVHARIAWRNGEWAIESLAPAGTVLLHGSPVRQGAAAPGDLIRLADYVGNFVTIKLPRASRDRLQSGTLRSALPDPGESFLIGSDPSCRLRLDHPLVQPRHAAVRRDPDRTLWIEDRRTAAGTYVNGRRLYGRLALSVGDVLQIGPFSARIGTGELAPLEQVAGIDIRVTDAEVTVPADRKGSAKTLLRDVCLHLKPATMTAVAGPSGAGKTTLMRLLSGQLPASAGSVRYNGADLAQCRQAYAALMGYVPQEDVVHAELTTAEALGYQARLRLGPGHQAETRKARIERAIGLLGLSEQAGQLVRTLSGGQRKRVSIACELLSEPEVMFLDEPTSGLDPGLDKRMMLLLRLLADQGRTVVLTTHAIAHVDVCDTLILVGPGGYVIYAGPPEAALDWFGVQALGDVFALVETPEAAEAAAGRVRLAQAAGHGPGWVAQPAADGMAQSGMAPSGMVAADRVAAVKTTAGMVTAGATASGMVAASPVLPEIRRAEQAPWIPRPHRAPPAPRDRATRTAGVGGTRQLFGSAQWRRAVTEQARIFIGRYLRLLGRDRAALAFSLLQGIAVALLTALVAPKPLVWQAQGNAPMFVFGCAAVWFGMISSVRELVKERAIWRREFLVGGSVPAYLASKVMVLSALAAFQSLTLTVVLGLTLGFPPASPVATPAGAIFIALWFGGLCGVALGLLVSATAPNADRAMSLVPYLLITQLVLCGVLFKLGDMTFASWIMPARWSVSALGSVAGLSAARLGQSAGLYPRSAIGLLATWSMLILLFGCGIAVTAMMLRRQGARWGVGGELARRGQRG